MEKRKTTTIKKEVKKEEKQKLNPLVWEVPFNADLISQVLYVYSSNERKGSAKQKSRGEVSGGGKKPWKQKGTGRARHGSTRSPLWVGGGVSFAIHERNFAKKINKKMVKKATCIMLSQRLRDKELEFVTVAKDEGKKLRQEQEKKFLIVTNNKDIELALRNVKRADVVDPVKLNAKHLVSARNIMFDKDVVKMLEERLINEK